MNKNISQDLKEIAELIERFNLDKGLDPVKALEETNELVMNLGKRFNGDTLYISVSEKNIRNEKVKELLKKGLSVRTIATRTGLSKSMVSYINRNK